ncbi:hypothetical protein VQ056_22460 [Paenibacillus sp. JTLBN-2024]
MMQLLHPGRQLLRAFAELIRASRNLPQPVMQARGSACELPLRLMQLEGPSLSCCCP